MSGTKFIDLLDARVPGLFFIIFMFVVLEIGILMVCAGFSGNRHILRIHDANGTLVYEDVYNESHIIEFKNLAGIHDFQEQGYVLTRTVVENEFPTRAWIALSIGIPLVLILFVAFIVRVFSDIFLAKPDPPAKNRHSNRSGVNFGENRFEKFFSTLGRLNIYALGAVVLMMALLLWMIPDLLTFAGKIGYQTVVEFKWVFLGLIVFGGVYLLLRTWLAHKTRMEFIRQQADIQKNRDRLVIEAKITERKLLADASCREIPVSEDLDDLGDSFEPAEEV